MTITEAWESGIRRLRRNPWAQGEWVELLESPLGNRYHLPFGKLHSILSSEDIPADIRIPPQDIPLWTVPDDGWDEHIDH